MDRLPLITAFTAFDRFAVNPSQLVAARLGLPFHPLEVSYEAVDRFVTNRSAASFDDAFLMGVAGSSSGFRLELLARNHVSGADVRGDTPSDRWIDAAAPAVLPGSLWTEAHRAVDPGAIVFSEDGGSYLCNYLYFRMLQRFPTKRIGFLHVPPLEAMGLERQVQVVKGIVRA